MNERISKRAVHDLKGQCWKHENLFATRVDFSGALRIHDLRCVVVLASRLLAVRIAFSPHGQKSCN
jgi:hypothetical protein